MSSLDWIRWIAVASACLYNGIVSFNYLDGGTIMIIPGRVFFEVLNLPGLIVAIAMRGGILSYNRPGATLAPWVGSGVNALIVAGILYLLLFALPRILTK